MTILPELEAILNNIKRLKDEVYSCKIQLGLIEHDMRDLDLKIVTLMIFALIEGIAIAIIAIVIVMNGKG